MEVLQLAYVFLLFLSLIVSRLSLVGMRLGVHHFNIFIGLIGMIATAMTLSLVVWGFATFPWYWPVGAFLLGSWLASLLVKNANFHVWYAVSPLPDILVTIGILHFWVWYWPF